MNTAVANCLNKEQYTLNEMRKMVRYDRVHNIYRGNFYKCPLCGKYHLTSRGAKHGR